MLLALVFLGYDPGGNGKHGVAALTVGSSTRRLEVGTASDGRAAIGWFRERCASPPRAIGVDTILSWELGPSGWRGADLALRERYPEVRNSVSSPNSLFGSMAIQGPAVVLALRRHWPDLEVTETHPKVVYFALAGTKYDWGSRRAMTDWLEAEFEVSVTAANEHEWDAALSAIAAWQGFSGVWKTDLMTLAREPILPVSGVKYFWPEVV